MASQEGVLGHTWNSIKSLPQRHLRNHQPTLAEDASSKRARGYQSTLSKFSLFPGLIVTTAISAALVYGYEHGPYINDTLYDFIDDWRSIVQAILSVLTHMLGFASLYVLTSVVNFSTRIFLTQQAPSLDRVKWWKSVSSKSIDFSLPLKFLLPVVLFFAFTLLPAFLWTGALTPNLVSGNVTLDVIVPYYPPDPLQQSWNLTWTPTAQHSVLRSPLGTFSYTPAYDRGGSMINTAAGAIFDKDNDVSRPRSDKTGFTYSARSYGVGASVGLAPPPAIQAGDGYAPQVSSYSYNETGYNASVTCAFNTSSAWKIQAGSVSNPSPYIPNIYYCIGSTPDNAMDWYLQYSAINDSNIVAINAHAEHNNPGGTGIVAIATGNGTYSDLDNLQCNVEFIPTLFQVDVDVTDYSVGVAALGPANDPDPSADPNASYESWTCNSLNLDDLNTTDCSVYTTNGQHGLGNIATRALRQLVDLSTIDTDLHRSNLGDMFLSNIQSEILYNEGVNFSIANSSNTSPNSKASSYDITYSAEQALKSLLDDTLLAFSSAQLVLHYSTAHKNTTGTATVHAIQFGTKGFVYSLFAFNLALILILIEEMLRTRLWKHLPLFNYHDLKSVIIASSMGGSAIAKKVQGAHEDKNSVWLGDPADQIASDVQVQLRVNAETGSAEIVTVNSGSGESKGPRRGFWGRIRYSSLKTAGEGLQRAEKEDRSGSDNASLP